MTEEAIVIAALEINDPAQRATFLDGGCGHDQELRRRVEALIIACEQAGVGDTADTNQPPAGITR
jgi:hypothetical protein